MSPIKIVQSLAILLLLQFAATAQQTPLFNIYRDHWSILNPAAISNNYLVNEFNYTASTGFRRQWLRLKDSPNVQLVNVEIVPPETDNIVTGGHILRYQTGLIDQVGLYGRFAYRIDLGRRVEQAVVAGLNAGVVQYRARLSDLELPQEEISGLVNDKIIYPDFSLGVYYYYSDLFYAGVSIPQTFGLNTVFRDSADNSFSVQRVQHFYGVAGGYIPVTWFNTEASFIEPSAWLRWTPHAPVSVDLNVRYQIKDFYWIGLGAGTGWGRDFAARLHVETGMVLGETIGLTNGQFKLGIGYSTSIAAYRTTFGDGIEINLLYSWY